MVDLSIIIITWNMEGMLRNLLQSIYSYTNNLTFEVIVIDNNSSDNTVAMIEREYPEVRLIKNERNRGVAAARNQGFHVAKGRYLQILDADMVLVEDSLNKLLDFMDNTPDAGLCGGMLVFQDGIVQPSCRRFPSPLALIMRRFEFLSFIKNSKTLRHHEMADWDKQEIHTVDYVIGACQIIRREAFEQVGYLDEKIFYGPEDIDYCLRMYKKGWKVYYYPHTKIIHYEQRITKKKLFSKISLLHLMGIFYIFWKYKGRLKRI